jgi:hypothetical protein
MYSRPHQSAASNRDIARRMCYAGEIVYSSLASGDDRMSAGAGDGVDRAAALQALVADTGVNVTPVEAQALVQSLARVQGAAATLLRPPSFDETVERFYRLLESAAAEGAGR